MNPLDCLKGSDLRDEEEQNSRKSLRQRKEKRLRSRRTGREPQQRKERERKSNAFWLGVVCFEKDKEVVSMDLLGWRETVREKKRIKKQTRSFEY